MVLENMSFWFGRVRASGGEKRKREKRRREEEKKKKKRKKEEENKKEIRYGIGLWNICIEFMYIKYVFGTLV